MERLADNPNNMLETRIGEAVVRRAKKRSKKPVAPGDVVEDLEQGDIVGHPTRTLYTHLVEGGDISIRVDDLSRTIQVHEVTFVQGSLLWGELELLLCLFKGAHYRPLNFFR